MGIYIYHYYIWDSYNYIVYYVNTGQHNYLLQLGLKYFFSVFFYVVVCSEKSRSEFFWKYFLKIEFQT